MKNKENIFWERKSWFAISLVILLLDQFLKYLIVKFNPSFDWNILKIHFVKNTGAGFGILQGKNDYLALISLAITILILIYYKKIPSEKNALIGYSLFLGGVIGNLLDRLLRGFVIDFIDFGWWPAFNVADAAITIGAVLLIIYYWKEES